MTRLFLNIAALALVSGALVGQAQANTEWRFPYKGVPYAVPHDHAKSAKGTVAVVRSPTRHIHR